MAGKGVRLLCVLASLAACTAPVHAASATALQSASGHLALQLSPGANIVAWHATTATGADLSLASQASGLPAGGWGACAFDAANAPRCVCPSDGTTCPGGFDPNEVQARGLRNGNLTVLHTWSPFAGHADFVEAAVTVRNDGPAALSGVTYRRVWSAAHEDAATQADSRLRPLLSFGARSPPPAALTFSAGSALVSSLPVDDYLQRFAAPPGTLCTGGTPFGPGTVSQGSAFTDVVARSGCAPGATVQLALGTLPPGGSVSFTLLFGRADSSAAADAAVRSPAIAADFWAIAAPADDDGRHAVANVWAMRGLGPGSAFCASCPGQATPGASAEDSGARDASWSPPQDSDHDGIQDAADNCPTIPNPGQADSDGNRVGDACDVPASHEPVASAPGTDRVPAQAGAVPAPPVGCIPLAGRAQDQDRDGIPDGCDPDRDGDGIVDQYAPLGSYLDNCPTVSNPDQADVDDDGRGDACAVPARMAQVGRASAVLVQQSPPSAIPAYLLLAGTALVVAAAALPAPRRWLALGFLGLFSRVRSDEVLEHPSRALVLELVHANPGIHAEALAREAGMSRGSLTHHLRVLERAAKLKMVHSAGRLLIFPVGTGVPVPRDAQLAIQHPSARRLMEIIRQEPGLSVSELAARTGVAYTAAHYHVRRFESLGAVRVSEESGVARVVPMEQPIAAH